MAPGLYLPFCEVPGNVRWSSVNKAPTSIKLTPGKLCLTRLADTFYIQCVFDTGKASKRVKLLAKHMKDISCRNGKFSFHLTVDGGTTFILQGGNDPGLQLFVQCLNTLKKGQTPVLQTNQTAAQKNSSLREEQASPTKTPTKPRTPQNPKVLNSNNQDCGINIKKPVLQTQNATAQESSRPSDHQTGQQSTEAKPNISQSPKSLHNKQQLVNIKKPDKNSVKENIVKFQDDCNKENKESADFKSAKRRNELSDNYGSEALHSFGTPHKKRPLNERTVQEVSPKCTTPNVKAFYGSASRSSLSLRNSVKKTPTRRAILDLSNSSGKSISSFSPPSLFQSEVTSKGFSNLGNTCYMNSILQSILGLVPFVHELRSKTILEQVNCSSLYRLHSFKLRCMYDLLCCKDEIGSSSRKQNCLKRVKNALSSREMTKRFSGNLQNDAHEFMNICLDQMKEEVQTAFGRKIQRTKQGEIQEKLCPVVRNFEGCVRKYISCQGCEDLATKDELFNHLSLNIPLSPASPVGYKLESLLEMFFQEEKVERRCEKCQCNSAIQSFKIQVLPRVMILHMLRNDYDKRLGIQEKKSDKINVSRFIDIGNLCSSNVRGPTPFTIKNITSSLTPSLQDNETPSSDIDDFVASKPRRRLDMSVAEDTSSNAETWKEDRLFYSTPPSDLPDWVFSHQETPKLSTDASLNGRRLCEMSDEEQLKLATMESLKTKQQEDQNALNRNPTVIDSDISESEIVEITEQSEMLLEETAKTNSQEQVVPGLDSTKKDRDFNENKGKLDSNKSASTSGKSRMTDKLLEQSSTGASNFVLTKCLQADERKSPTEDKSRKRASNIDISAVAGIGRNLDSNENKRPRKENEKAKVRDIEAIEDSVGTPTKRRKVQDKNGTTKNQSEDFIDLLSVDEDSDLKRALELSREQAISEQSQVEEAIKLSLEDNGINVDLLKFANGITCGPEAARPRKGKDNHAQVYRLASVVSHIGRSTSEGHYISDVFDMKSEQWTRYNDVHAEKVNEHQVRYDKHVDGYIYFYMHKNCADEVTGQKR